MIRKSMALAAFGLIACLPFTGLADEGIQDPAALEEIQGLDPQVIVAELLDDQERSLAVEMRDGWRRFAPVHPVTESTEMRVAQDRDHETAEGS